MSSPAQVLAKYLIDSGVAKVSSSKTPWPVTTSMMPSDPPDNRLSVYDSGTDQEGKYQQSGTRVVKYEVQVRIRSADYSSGWDKGETIQSLLDRVGIPVGRGGVGRPTVVLDGVSYVLEAVHVSTPLVRIGQEELNRQQVFTLTTKLTLSRA